MKFNKDNCPKLGTKVDVYNPNSEKYISATVTKEEDWGFVIENQPYCEYYYFNGDPDLQPKVEIDMGKHNCYTLTSNIKAFNFLNNAGYAYQEGVHVAQDALGQNFEPLWEQDVYYWHFGGSGTQFHKLLEDNGLLLSQQ